MYFYVLIRPGFHTDTRYKCTVYITAKIGELYHGLATEKGSEFQPCAFTPASEAVF
jgi:hypothetical protein